MRSEGLSIEIGVHWKTTESVVRDHGWKAAVTLRVCKLRRYRIWIKVRILDEVQSWNGKLVTWKVEETEGDDDR